MDPNALPRAIALQFDNGEIVYPAGGQPVMRAYSYNGCGVRLFGKSTDFLEDPRYRQAHARGWNSGGKKTRHIDNNRWIMHVALWAATQAARLDGDFVRMRRRYRNVLAGDLRLARLQPARQGFLVVRHLQRYSRRADVGGRARRHRRLAQSQNGPRNVSHRPRRISRHGRAAGWCAGSSPKPSRSSPPIAALPTAR